MKEEIELIATAGFGLEAVVAREVKRLGYDDLTVENGGVTIRADLEAIPRLNLWLRCADRILVKMGEFPARSFEELFQNTRALPWADLIPEDGNFPVEGKSIKSQLFSVSDCQAIVKKAVVEKMKERYRLQWFPETGARYTIEVALLKDIATLTVDTSGAGLHKRGYRRLSAPAPLKETLAAALIDLSYWDNDRLLLDPFCGSGTIPIEAALIGLNIAPGSNREFAAEKWPLIPKKYWQLARSEARDRIKREKKLSIRGTDIDKEVLSLARYHARQAGVEEHIHFQAMPVSAVSSHDKYGCIICNPPYGERLEDKATVEELYRQMGGVFRVLDSWSVYVLTAHQRFESLYGRTADRRRKLYNGRIQCCYYQFYGPRPPKDRI
ncbi:THUMP domain-containing class I SAM-dependent RNA methyltransferase [Syntrophomonas curvata]